MSTEALCAAYDAAMLACDTVGTQPLRMAVRDAVDGHVIIDVWWLCAEMVEATVMSRTVEMALSADNEGWHMTRPSPAARPRSGSRLRSQRSRRTCALMRRPQPRPRPRRSR